MLHFISNFANCEDGAVTVDWVVLTAAIIGLPIIAYQTILGGTENITGNTVTTLSDMTVGDVSVGE
jgi:Flp pilus assembly pilin Flp